MPAPRTLADLVTMRGLTHLNGAPTTEQPAQDEPLPICAGPWPYPVAGGRQHRCAICSSFVGLGPEAQALRDAHPSGRPIFCCQCFLLFTTAYEDHFKALGPDIKGSHVP